MFTLPCPPFPAKPTVSDAMEWNVSKLACVAGRVFLHASRARQSIMQSMLMQRNAVETPRPRGRTDDQTSLQQPVAACLPQEQVLLAQLLHR